MSPNTTPSDIASGVSKLSLETTDSNKPTAKDKPAAKVKPRKEEVADSWEEEDVSSESGTEAETDTYREPRPGGIAAPPPTPISPTPSDREEAAPGSASSSGYVRSVPGFSSPSARPEKTDAVARRMIAGALGLKAPKLTEEQKAYQAAIKEKERKRREEQKAAEKANAEAAAKARAAIWDD